MFPDDGIQFVRYYLSCFVLKSAFLLQNHIAGINPEVEENIDIAVILISLEMGDGIAMASHGNTLLFKKKDCLYYGLQLKATHGVRSRMSTAAVWVGLDDHILEKVISNRAEVWSRSS